MPVNPQKDKDELKINEEIRSAQVRLIDENGENVGIVSRDQALATAREAEFDLVEVSPEGDPPVCRIMDYGKHKYRLKKKMHQSRVKQHQPQLKALRLSPVTEEHDVQVKLNRAREFLGRRDRVTFNMLFRGRQVMHADIGMAIMDRIAKGLEDIAKVETPPKMEGKRLWMVLAPKQ